MNKAKAHYITGNGLMENETLGCLRVYLTADYETLLEENEALRATALEMRNWISCSDVNHRKGEFHDGDECPVLARIDAAIQGEQK